MIIVCSLEMTVLLNSQIKVASVVYCPLQHTCHPVAQTSCEQMANAEVSIPVGDVVVVPTEGTEGGNPEDTKTQVILQLQPVQQG